jgi:penicillin-binding protein 1C
VILKYLNVNKNYLFVVFALLFLVFFWFWTKPDLNNTSTIKIYSKNKKLLYEAENQIGRNKPITLEQIPDLTKKTLILAEDKRFKEHSGIDFFSLLRAAKDNLQAGKIVSGGSTITQQVARFTTISPYKPAKTTFLRKIRESLIALRISSTNSKDSVLEKYFNIMHWGRNTYGIEAASQLYFNKTTKELSPAESALLISMIPNPVQYDPINNPEQAETARNKILVLMQENNLISKNSLQRAQKEPLPEQIQKTKINAPHSVSYILAQAQKLGINLSRGASIYTTIDLNLQQQIEQIAKHQVEMLAEKHNLNNSAVVVLDNKQGSILAMIGGVDYFDQSIQGENNLTVSLRQPGSTLKPFAYALAFEEKLITPGTIIKDYPKVYPTQTGEGYQPRNYDNQYHGPVLAREALASSYNLPAVEVLKQAGIKNFLDLLHNAGINSMEEVSRYDLALVLGGGEITLLDLTNAYATLARQGKYQPTQIIKSIKATNGDFLYQTPAKKEQKKVISQQTAWLISDILADQKARMPGFGEKNPLVLPYPAAVKTGTTTDWHDNWTVGYTPNYTIGVWVGNTDNQPMNNISGITGAAPIWNKSFAELLKTTAPESFLKPPGITAKEICKWDGLLATSACTEKYTEFFLAGTEPKQYTPLKEKPGEDYYLDTPIQIINPKQNYHYQIDPSTNSELVFQVSLNSRIKKVEWFLNNKKLNQPNCSLNCFWKAVKGKHTLYANVYFKDNSKKQLAEVSFIVSEYREDW